LQKNLSEKNSENGPILSKIMVSGNAYVTY